VGMSRRGKSRKEGAKGVAEKMQGCNPVYKK
jgi:hypothetical protein